MYFQLFSEMTQLLFALFKTLSLIKYFQEAVDVFQEDGELNKATPNEQTECSAIIPGNSVKPAAVTMEIKLTSHSFYDNYYTPPALIIL